MSIKFYKNGESKYKYSKYLGITDIYITNVNTLAHMIHIYQKFVYMLQSLNSIVSNLHLEKYEFN